MIEEWWKFWPQFALATSCLTLVVIHIVTLSRYPGLPLRRVWWWYALLLMMIAVVQIARMLGVDEFFALVGAATAAMFCVIAYENTDIPGALMTDPREQRDLFFRALSDCNARCERLRERIRELEQHG